MVLGWGSIEDTIVLLIEGGIILRGSIQKDIFIGFFRAGMLGYGGGPSAIPFVHKEVVERYHWLNDEEFSDVLALGNTLPGPIATKMAGYIGYRIGGWLGLLNATIATVLPTVLLMISLIGVLSVFRDSPIVRGMTAAIAPVVGVMLLTLTYSFFKQSKNGIGWKATLLLGLVSIILFAILEIHPAFLIGGLLLTGLLYNPDRKKNNSEQKVKDRASL
jgi:chromate transporter